MSKSKAVYQSDASTAATFKKSQKTYSSSDYDYYENKLNDYTTKNINTPLVNETYTRRDNEECHSPHRTSIQQTILYETKTGILTDKEMPKS